MSATAPDRPRASGRVPRMHAVLRQGERVTPLELFFDLVFVLALTQCTALITRRPDWVGVAQGLLVLAVLWWSWVGYAWLTSVVDPEEGAVRLAIFLAMAALLVAALCVPGAFGADALLFAGAYGVVRCAHILLFRLASREDRALRHSVSTLGVSTALGVGLLVGAGFAGGDARGALWVLAVALDMAGPYFFGSDGWRLAPGHFAERHGAVVIIALGESVVALGVGARVILDVGEVLAVVLGVAVVAALWWLYFDVTALVAERRLVRAAAGRERNELARDSYSYLHLPLVAGVVLLAVGLRLTLAHVERPLAPVPTASLLGGAALYLLAHVAFRLRNMRSLSVRRLVCAALLLALVPAALALRPASLVTLGALTAVLVGLISYEVLRYAEARDRIRHLAPAEGAPPGT